MASTPTDPVALPGVRRVKQQALLQLREVLTAAIAEERRAETAAARLTAEIDEDISANLSALREKCRHTYGVFAVGGSRRRRLVLRDIAELDGRPPESVTGDFGEALRRASARLQDAVQSGRGPDVPKLDRGLRHLLAAVQKIAEHNARLTGDGSSAQPYNRPYGGATPVAGPMTLAFPNLNPEQITLHRDGRTLRISQKPSPA